MCPGAYAGRLSGVCVISARPRRIAAPSESEGAGISASAGGRHAAASNPGAPADARPDCTAVPVPDPPHPISHSAAPTVRDVRMAAIILFARALRDAYVGAPNRRFSRSMRVLAQAFALMLLV